MSAVTAIAPAPWPAMLEMGGRSGFMRRAFILQRAKCDTIAYFAGGELLAVAMFFPVRRRLVELALAFAPAAARHMRALVRQAHLTLSRIAQTGVLVFARVEVGYARGARLAGLSGFSPGRLRDRQIWLWKGTSHG